MPLFDVFKSSLINAVFPDSLKIAKVLPIFKGDNTHGQLPSYFNFADHIKTP